MIRCLFCILTKNLSDAISFSCINYPINLIKNESLVRMQSIRVQLNLLTFVPKNMIIKLKQGFIKYLPLSFQVCSGMCSCGANSCRHCQTKSNVRKVFATSMECRGTRLQNGTIVISSKTSYKYIQ